MADRIEIYLFLLSSNDLALYMEGVLSENGIGDLNWNPERGCSIFDNALKKSMNQSFLPPGMGKFWSRLFSSYFCISFPRIWQLALTDTEVVVDCTTTYLKSAWFYAFVLRLKKKLQRRKFRES